MSKTIRPTVDHFRRAGWIPKSNEVYKEWMGDITRRIRHPLYLTQVPLLPPLLEFKKFIETHATVYEEFVRMFEGVTEAV